MPTPIDWDVIARDRASRTFVNVAGAAQRGTGIVGRFGTTLAGVFTGQALLNGVERLARGFFTVAEGAAADEQAQRTMARQYVNSAGARQSDIDATERWITKQGEVIGITDDELRPALTRAVTATEDVAEAQKLVALGMEVSAGKGKALQTVVEALSRGEDGNTAALGRLGIKTKNAAGETLTFEQITGRLARTFKGQASEAADTAAGKYQRVKTRFSELAEEIGYNALPRLTEWGDWILEDGVPLAQDLAHWVGDELGPTWRDMTGWVAENKDEFRDFGSEVLDVVIPALRATGDIAGDLVGFLSDLPGPVKQYGLEALIAARYVGMLNTSLANGRDLFSSYTTGAEAAQKRTEAIGRAARAAGGIGGMLLLADSTQRSSDALGILEGAAGGALMGSAAGPWGALIGGGLGGAMSLLARQTGKAGDAAGDAQPNFEGLADTLDQVTGATTAATRAFVDDELQRAKILPLLAAEGIDRRVAVNAVLGEKSARQQVNAVLREQAAAYEETEAKIGSLTEEMNRLADSDNDALTAPTRAELEKAQAIQDEIDALTDLNATRKKTADTIKSGMGLVREETAAQRERARVTADYSGKLKGIPKDIRSLIVAEGLVPTAKGVAELIAKYDSKLDKRDVKTIIEAAGVDATAAQVQRLIDKLNAIPRNITTHINQVRGHDINSGAPRIGTGYVDQSGARADFIGGFTGMQGSIFDLQGDESNPLTVDSILAAGAAEQAKAEKAQRDLVKLLGMGLSKSLILQLQSKGASGLAALSTLADGANAQQIAMLNAQDVATAAALSGMGGAAAVPIFGSPADDSLPAWAAAGHGPRGGKGGKGRDEFKTAVRDGVMEGLADLNVEFRAKGSVLVGVLKAERKDRGGAKLGFDT